MTHFLDCWFVGGAGADELVAPCKTQPDKPSRSEAIKHLVEPALKAS